MYELNDNDKVVIVSHAHCDNKENTLLEKEFEGVNHSKLSDHILHENKHQHLSFMMNI